MTRSTVDFWVYALHAKFGFSSMVYNACSGLLSLTVNGIVHILVIGSLGPRIIGLFCLLTFIAVFVNVTSHPSSTS